MLYLFQILFNNISPEGILFDVFNISVNGNTISGSIIPLALLAILWIIASYFIGSLNFSIIISRFIYHDDVRKHGSANAGSSNMQRTYGNKAGAVTLICDMAKGIVAVLLARILFGENVAYLSGALCIVGHCFPCFFSFKGGKGVATAAAVILALNPLVFIVLVTIFALLVFATRYISLGSIVAGLLFPVFLDRYYAILFNAGVSEYQAPTFAMAFSSIFIGILVVARHYSNIKKLLSGDENKLSFKGKKSKGSDIKSDIKPIKSLHNIDDED